MCVCVCVNIPTDRYGSTTDMRGENNLNFRLTQQCLVLFHYQPPYSERSKTKQTKTNSWAESEQQLN